jgi:hypothetical protein
MAPSFAFLNASPSQGQEWAARMFNTLSHDFGTLPRGSKAVCRFQVKNLYEEDVHVKSVRSTCGCTTPQVVKPNLKTFEVGEIVAEFNTTSYVGQKHATVVVTFDKPFFAEVQLQIHGYIRGDVVVTPGDIKLGSIDQGQDAEKQISVVHMGRNDWEIVDVKTVDPHFEVELSEPLRGGGRVAYDMLVRLTKDAPAGYIHDQLILVTNDRNAPELYVEIDGRVVSAITVSPSSLFMGVVHPGQTVKKQLVVRGKKPFKIVDVKCEDKSFSVEPGDDVKPVHLVPVLFKAEGKPGKVSREITLTTDVGSGDKLVFTAYAQVVADKPSEVRSQGPNDEVIDEPSETPKFEPKKKTGDVDRRSELRTKAGA